MRSLMILPSSPRSAILYGSRSYLSDARYSSLTKLDSSNIRSRFITILTIAIVVASIASRPSSCRTLLLINVVVTSLMSQSIIVLTSGSDVRASENPHRSS